MSNLLHYSQCNTHTAKNIEVSLYFLAWKLCLSTKVGKLKLNNYIFLNRRKLLVSWVVTDNQNLHEIHKIIFGTYWAKIIMDFFQLLNIYIVKQKDTVKEFM